MNVVLVNMPFASASRPSLALGLLKSQLGAIGASARVENIASSFAELVGRDEYLYVSDQASPELLAGEWVFASCLFGEDAEGPEPYQRLAASPTYAADLDALRHARSCAEGFLQRCLAAVDWHSYDVVGFTTTFAQNVASLALARRIKDAHPSCRIVFGGANCEGEMGLALHRCFPFVDFVCSGEADLSFPSLMLALHGERTAAEIPGVVARDRGGSLYRSLDPVRVRDLDELPYPNFDEFFDRVGPTARRVAVMETARGCWWGDKHHCTFCGIDFPLKYRSKSPGRALDELLTLRDRYRVQTFVMTDEILDLRYFDELIPRLAELEKPVSLFYETKANLTKERVEQLARAGIRQIQPGIESFSDTVLRSIDKGVTAAQNVQLLKWCEEVGIEPRWNILYGVPGESPSDYAALVETIRALGHLHPPQACGPIRLDRFSPYFAKPAAYGVANVRPSPAYALVYALPHEALARLAYYFDFDFVDGRDPVTYTASLREAVRRWSAGYRKGLLLYADDGELVTIVDHRPSRARTFEYSGWKRDVYLDCEVSRPRGWLERVARRRGATLGQLRGFLAELIDAKLMVQLGGRFVGLAVNAPELPPAPARSRSATEERLTPV